MPVQKKSLISTRTATQKAIIASKPDLGTKVSQPLTVAKKDPRAFDLAKKNPF